jgi:signal transduction histidine kinase
MPNAEPPVSSIDPRTAERASLLDAFARFQRHCEKLDAAHHDLRRQLAQAELRLEEKNRELARRVHEIDVIKSRLSAVIESIPDPLMVIGADARIELANTAAQRAFAATAGAGLAAAVPAVAGLMSQESPFRDVEIGLSGEGGDRTMMATASPLAETGGGAPARVLVLKDVTEYRRLQERLARDNRLAALGQVAANVAHEIRNPLAAIAGFGRLLEQDLARIQPGPNRLLARMIFAANQMNCVVSNLLNYAREGTPCFLPAALAVLVREVMDMMELKAVEGGVEMLLATDETQGACMLDPTRMKEVVVNLVANAIQACPPRSGGRIEIAVGTRQGMVELTVADNGRGIPEEALTRIFEPFYTLKDDGVGLGLALCRRIIEEHEGSIVAENRPDGGALFRARFPVRQTQSPQKPAAAAVSAGGQP